LLVVNPTGDLRGVELEAEWIRRATPNLRWQALHGADATREALLLALASADTLHLGTHALFDLDDAFSSRLLLAGGGSLTLRDWLPVLERHAPACVVLSACETAIARVTSLPDEAIGFPTALVEHGVGSVLGTLWEVDDAAAALVMGSYYEALAEGTVSRAAALRRAQQAVRAIDVRTLVERLKALRSAGPRVAAVAAGLRTRLREWPSDARPFAEPVHWAPFVLVGG
jgi:CHAT domain-containing protein